MPGEELGAAHRRGRADALHLFVLSSVGIAYPLLEVLSRAPEFLVVYGVRRLEVITLVLIVCFAVPVALALAERAAGAGGEWLRGRLHTLLVLALWTAVAAPVANRVLSGLGAGSFLVALLAGTLLTWMYEQREELRGVLTTLSPVIVILPLYFLFLTPLSSLILPPPPPETPASSPAASAPIVMIVFDEFPLGSLLDGKLEIDAARYPNIARLARDGIWFRNATSVAGVTQAALAAILTGNYPTQDPIAVPENRSRNLFSLVAGSHGFDVRESYVHYCAEALCPPEDTPPLVQTLPPILHDLAIVLMHVLLPESVRGWLPSVRYPWLMMGPGGKASRTGLQVDPVVFAAQRDHHLADPSHRAKLVHDFADGIEAADRPMLHYLHVALPHEPSVYLPNGDICLPELMREPMIWPKDQATADRAYQRHLLQVEYVDRWIGELLNGLEKKGLYDSSLIVLTADHGVSYRPGEPRRALSKENYCDILAVPLIVKPPGSHTGRISDRNVELVDVLPTVAELLKVELPWPVTGRSMIAEGAPDREQKTVIGPYWFGLEAPFFGSSERVELPARFPEACFGIERTLAMRSAPAPGCVAKSAPVVN